MKSKPLAQAVALVLAAALGGAIAQTAPSPSPKVLSDMAPLPAEERGSTGAIVLEDKPVLAKQEMMRATVSRNQQMMTSVMGAGPAPIEKSDNLRGVEIRDGKVYILPGIK